jgi:phosphoribosylglycinamide formyltransferase-1
MNEKLRIGILASGSGTNLQALTDACQKDGLAAEVAVVITNKADAGAIVRCEKACIPWRFVDHRRYPTRRDFDGELVKILREARVELVLLAGFMRILSEFFIDCYPHAIINIHPALLPAFPGLHAARQALEYGVRFSGCTVHFVDKGVDTGPIILQAVVPVLEDDSEDSLHARIQEQEHRIYPQAVRLFAEKRLQIEGRKVRILPPRP